MAVAPVIVAGTLVITLLAGSTFTDWIAYLITGGDPSDTMGDAAKLAARGQEVWRLRLSAWSACALLAIQVAGGVWANSAALFAQTLQLVSEANEGVMAICALELMSKRATAECTFGLQQAGALGTFLTILLIWLLGMVLLVQDMHRFIHLEVVDGAMVMVFAAAGLFFHILVERIVGGHRVDLGATLSARDLHIGASRSATSPSGDHGIPTTALSQLAAHGPVPGRPPLPGPRGRDLDGGGPPPSRSIRFSDGAEERHIDPRVAGGRQAGFSVATDIIFALLVMAAGGLSWWQPFASFEPVSGVSRWCYADLFVAVLVTGRTIMSTTGAMNEALMQLLMACPRNFNLYTFQKSMRQLEGVVSLHDLHVWQLGRTRLCTAHLVVSDSSDPMKVLRECNDLAHRQHIDEATFQIDRAGRTDPFEARLRLSSTTCHDTIQDDSP